MPEMLRDYRIGGIILIFIALFLLRIYHLGYYDFWYDEIATVGYAQYPWRNWNAPLYWIILHYWINVFGLSEFSLRFPSAIASFLSVISVFFLGKYLFNRQAGMLAACLMGLSPFHLWYAQEARDHSLALLFSLLSSYFFLKAIQQRQLKYWIVFILASWVGLYTSYFCLFLFLSQGLYLFCLKRTRFSLKEIGFLLVIVLGFSFYLPNFWQKFTYIQQGFWVPRPDFRSLIITLEDFILGYNGFPLIYLASDILVAVLFTLGLKYGLKPEFCRPFVYCLFVFLFPILLAFSFSRAFFSIYLPRSLIIFSPYLYLILALGASSLKRGARAISLLALFSILLVADYRYFADRISPFHCLSFGTPAKKPFKPLAHFFKENLMPADMLAFTNQHALLPFRHYFQNKAGSIYFFFNPDITDSNWKRPIQERPYSIPFSKIGQLKFKRLWVVYSDWARSGALDDNSMAVRNWMDEHYKLEFNQEQDGLWVSRYVRY